MLEFVANHTFRRVNVKSYIAEFIHCNTFKKHYDTDDTDESDEVDDGE